MFFVESGGNTGTPWPTYEKFNRPERVETGVIETRRPSSGPPVCLVFLPILPQAAHRKLRGRTSLVRLMDEAKA